MAFDPDDELYQDFLVEAGETLENLGGYLVELEQSPEDTELLNQVFRAFHNIKGGGGFLGLNTLVDVCHHAEDVFNTLRQGKRRVDPDLMDAVLQAVDVVNDMMDQIRAGEEPPPAEPALLERLAVVAQEVPAEAPSEPAAEPVADPPEVPLAGEFPDAGAEETGATGDGADQAFDALLDAAHGNSDDAAAPSAPASDEITDEEFEALLDQLHGPGQHHGAPAEPAVSVQPEPVASPPQAGGGADDEITDDEFETLLDQLHGPGQHRGTPVAPAPAQPTAGPSSPQPHPSAAADEITDEEFEALLDKLHGSAPRAATPAGAEQAKPSQAPAPPPKPVPVPAHEAAKTPAHPQHHDAAAKSETTVRVDTRRLDEMMNMVGELVLVRNRLNTLGVDHTDEELVAAVGNLDMVTSDLQLAVMKTRMQPIKKVFGRFPRVVRDLARGLKKEVTLELQGEDTDLDKNLVEALGDPLVHLVRNAVDHGIEMPDDRAAAGKSRIGTVALTAAQEGDHILLTIEDDGRGMDAETLRQKAVEKGMLDADAAARLDIDDCLNLIFLPGFSTKTAISDISGRGVGLDVVKTRITQLNGSVRIETELNKGTRFYIKVPLTLAIMPTLMVVVGEQVYALPLLSIVEIIEYDPKQTRTIDGQLVIILRDKAVPLFHLRQWLSRGKERHVRAETGHVVITAIGSQRVGFLVDQLVGQEEVVIKPLGSLLHGTRGLAGATITGNGRIALILDLVGLVGAYGSRMGEVA